MYFSIRRDWLKYCLGWLLCIAFRLFPGRLPNVEPILGAIMPFSEQFGALPGALFAGASIVFYDVLTGAVGVWTLVTAGAYMVVAAGATVFLSRNRGDVRGYMLYAVIGTIIFDALTGLTIGPIFYGQPFGEAFVGQIPFTLLHLLGNLVFAAVLSPLLYRWVAGNPVLEFRFKSLTAGVTR